MTRIANYQEWLNLRTNKAEKIQAVLEDFLGKPVQGYTMADIGCHVGIICDFFAQKNTCVGVDFENSVTVKNEKFSFITCTDENIPIESDSIDIVIYNHVIEHVRNQLLHLKEIHRILRHSGICYFSAPNRFFPKDSHSNLWFFHYMPVPLYMKYLRKINRYTGYTNLPTYLKQRDLCKKANFKIKEYTAEILRRPFDFHMRDIRPLRIPAFLQALSKINIYILYK